MKKEKYSLRKTKFGTVSVVVGLSVVGALSFSATDAHAADETVKPVDNKVEEKQTEKTNAEKLKESNKEIATVEKQIADSKNKQAEAEQNIAKVEKEIADNEALLEKSKKIEEANKKLEAAEKEKATAESKAKDTAAKLKDNSEEIATTEKNIKDNEAEKQKIATEIKEYEGPNVTEEEVNAKKAEVDKLEADLAAKTKEIETKKQENSKINIDELNKRIQEEDAKTDTLKKEAENKKTEVDKLKEEINTPVTTEDPDLKGYDLSIITSPEWVSAVKINFEDMKKQKENTKELNEVSHKISELKSTLPYTLDYEGTKKEISKLENQFDQLWKTSNQLQTNTKKSDEKIIETETTVFPKMKGNKFETNNINNTIQYKTLQDIPNEVKLRLNKYYVALLNNFKTLFNQKQAHANTEAIRFAEEVAHQTEAEHYTDPNHFGRAINDAARRRGLTQSEKPGVDTTAQNYENLTIAFNPSSYYTEKQLADLVRYYIHGFMYEGHTTGHLGHMGSLLYGNNETGFAFSRPSNTILKMHVIQINSSLEKSNDTSALDKQNIKYVLDDKNASISFPAYDIPNPGENVDKTELKTKLEKAEKELVELEKQAKSQELQARTNHIAKEQYLQFINHDLPNFENKVLPMIKQELEKATAIYNATKERFEHPEIAKTKFDELNNKLTELGKTLDMQYRRLDELKKLKATLEQEYNDQKAEVESLTTSITNTKNQLYAMPRPTKSAMELTADLNDARTTLADVEKDGKKEIERIKELTERLATLKAENTKLQNLIKLEETLKLNKDNTAAIPLVAPTTESLPEVTVNETTTTTPIDFKVVEKLDPTLEKGKRVVQTKGQKGSQKVTVTEFKLGDKVLYTDQKPGDKVDPVDEVVLVGTKEVKLPPQRPSRREGTPQQIGEEKTPQGEREDAEVVASDVEENNTTVANNIKQKALPKTSTEANNSLAGVGLVSLIAAALAGRRKREGRKNEILDSSK